MFFARTRPQLLAIALGLLFALQMLVVVPQHHFHEHAAPAFGAHASSQGPQSTPQPDDCRCDFCVAFNSLDTGSVATPPVLGLAESFFAPIASPDSVFYSRTIFSFHARGPPAMSA